MSHPTRRSQSSAPMRWRTGGGGMNEPRSRSTSKTRVSFDSSVSTSWRDQRDDMESGRSDEEIGTSEESPEEYERFDHLLKRIEAERKKMTTTTTTAEIGLSRSPRSPRRLPTEPRRGERGAPSSAPSNYDFATRAQELRMEVDEVPTPKSETSSRPGRDQNDGHFFQLARDMTPPTIRRRGSPSHGRTIVSDDMQPYSPSSNSNRFSGRSRETPPRSPISTTPSSKEDFKIQVEKFRCNLVSARDTITTLEKDVRNLKSTVEEKDESISSLEHRNESLSDSVESLSEALVDNRKEINKNNQENKRILAEEISAITEKYTEEREKVRTECNGYKKHVEEVDKLSAECVAAANEVEREKEKLETSIQDKDNMIGSLRDEIQRLNEELADGSFVRSQAQKAEDNAKRLEVELDKSKTDHASATKVIEGLEKKLRENAYDFDRAQNKKENEIEILQSKLANEQSMKQSSERMKDEVCSLESQLDESKQKNIDLIAKVQDFEEHMARAEREAAKNENDSKQLSAWSESRETELRRQLKTERREFERQRERMEKYDIDSAVEQETVAALGRGIQRLEIAHNEANSEINRLRKEKQSLAATLSEAEDYMKKYGCDMKDSAELKSRLRELQGINSELTHHVLKKDEQIKELNEQMGSLEMQVETQSVALKQKIVQLEKLVERKQDDIFRMQTTKSKSHEQDEDAAKKLGELSALFEENEGELQKLRVSKGRMLRTISMLEKEMGELKKKSKSKALGTKFDHEQAERSQKESKRAWARVGELEECLKTLQDELSTAEQKPDELKKAWARVGELEEYMETLEDKLFTAKQKPDESKRAWARVRELEEYLKTLQDKLSRAEQQPNNTLEIQGLTAELTSLENTVAQRDEELAESRKGIAEAQKMIFRLMNTVQDLRRKAKQ